jgi:replication factor C subunit 3/5
MNENKTDIWVEKYRPTNFNDIVLSPINRKIFKNIIDMNYFPNLLFYGPPGTGKTTTIINLINEYQTRYSKINSSTIIHLNASDERGIDIIRNQINQFVKSMNLFENGLKFVILDEVDYMTKNAQQALKYILQTSIHNVRFCLICNYISKIDESLKNEFICVRFNQLPPEYICNFLRGIITKEGIYLKDVTIQSIQKMYGSDIRSMINFIQLNQNLNIEDWERNIITDEDFGALHEVIMTPSFGKERIMDGGVSNCSGRRGQSKSNTQTGDSPPNTGVQHQKIEERGGYIHRVSVQYNIDKKTLLLKYYDWVLRNRKDELVKGEGNDFFEKMENIIHNTGDVPIEILWGQV